MLNAKKILLVDDNKANLMLAQIILERQGAAVTIAWNGQEAVEQAQANYFDLLLMDLQMPVMDGFEATVAIRKKNKIVPVVALTANTLSGEEDKCKAIGMNGFLAKPYKEKVLLDLIYKTLHLASDNVKGILSSSLPGSKLYTLENLESIAQGNREFMKMMIDIFISDAEETVMAFDKAIAENDALTIKTMAHRIKPTLETFGISFFDQIRRIELLIEYPEAGKELKKLILEFKILITKVLDQMRNNYEY